jgi:hypothetical protein
MKKKLIEVALPLEAINKAYEAFLEWRQERLWREICRVIGATVAADLEANDDDR